MREMFVIKNLSSISTVESLLRSLSWLLPGRFPDADLVSESLSTTLNVVTLYHDILLSKIKSNKPLLPISPHTRFTSACVDRLSPYATLARTLQFIFAIQLWSEFILRRSVSSNIRKRSIVFIELIKSILRLYLLKTTRRPLLSSPLPDRVFDIGSLSESNPSCVTPDHLKNNRVPLVPPILDKAITPADVKPALSILSPLSLPHHWLSELVYILRPLIYATLLATSKHPNRPILTLLSLDFLSRSIRRSPPVSSQVERAEYAKRDRDLLWYFLRGSIWKDFTRPRLDNILDRTSNTPLRLITTLASNWFPLVDDYYYYTAP